MADILIPGLITPPWNAPSAETRSYVVAVPKSTTITGPPYCSYALTASTIQSGPISLGLAVSIRMPGFVPAPTTIGKQWRYFIIPLVNEYII